MNDPDQLKAAVVAVGTELVIGLRADTNGPEIARRLDRVGYTVTGIHLVPDDRATIASTLARLVAEHPLVIVTGGLGPTHDDVTRGAAADALACNIAVGSEIASGCAASQAQTHPAPQAALMPNARVIQPTVGTAPGQVVSTGSGTLVLLPGPPAEMRPMLDTLANSLPSLRRAAPRVIGCVGVSESEAQVYAEEALRAHAGVTLGVLSRPALVDLVLIDSCAGARGLEAAAADVVTSLGHRIYSSRGETLESVVVALARGRTRTIGVVESCTGGLLGGAITAVPGSSAVFRGGIVAYDNRIKHDVLGVPRDVMEQHGAVSEHVAIEMAMGGRRLLGADVCVSVTGIAGPHGGSPEKPVGTVALAISHGHSATAEWRLFRGDREGIRRRSVISALDLLRHTLLSGD